MELNKTKTVLVTGASRGIGRAFALALAKKNCSLVLTLRKPDSQLEKELIGSGATQVKSYIVDFSTRHGVEQFCKMISDDQQKIDVLINNAGLLTGGLLENQKVEDIYAMMQVNLLAVTHLCHFFIPRMLAQGGGKIVNNASVSGKMFLPCANTYAAAKAGVVALSESLFGELAGTPVSILLLITPGVKTDMFDDIYKQYSANMDLSFLSSISAEEWAQKVVQGIENDDLYVMPSGSSRVGVWLGQHASGLLRRFVSNKFKR